MADTKKVSIGEEELKELLAQNRKLMEENSNLSRNGGKEFATKATPVAERMVTIFFINEKPVVGYVNHGTKDRPTYIYQAPDPRNPKDYILYVDVMVQGEEKPLKLNYTEFLRDGGREECPVTNIREVPWVKEQGSIAKRDLPESAYRATFGESVPVEVKGKHRFFTVRLPNGKELELQEMYVNIAK